MDADKLDTCYVATVHGHVGQINLTVYRAPSGWRWMAHDTATGSHTGDGASTPEQAKEAAEQFARGQVQGDYVVQWTMAFVRTQAG